MHWSGKAITLSTRRFDEHGAIVKVLSHEHGIYSGVARYARSSKQRGIFEPGNIVEATWSARLPEHLGTIKGELVTPVAALVMQDALALAGLRSALSLLEDGLPERDALPRLYEALEDLALRLMTGHAWEESYVRLELCLLAHLGFGLDLVRCAATGSMEELCYVSPKSGRAVSREAGTPYHDRLFPLPSFLLQTPGDSELATQELLDGIVLTGYFLDARAFAPHGKNLPPARLRFMEMVQARFHSNLS